MAKSIRYFRQFKDAAQADELTRSEALMRLGRTFLHPWHVLKETSKERPAKTAFAFYWIERSNS